MGAESRLEALRKRKKAKVSARPDTLVEGLSAQSTIRMIQLDQIESRAQDSREENESHSALLRDSISAIGLISPLTLDRELRLLAGGHRLSALRQLSEEEPDRFAELFPMGVPVRVMDLLAREDELLALRVELEENEKRRDYSPEEVCRAADRLLAEGYVHQRGRPRPGDRQLLPALELIFGKSRATLKRYLAARAEEGGDGSDRGPSKKQSAQRLKRQHQRLCQGLRDHLHRVDASEQALTQEESVVREQLEVALSEVQRLIDQLISAET